MNGIPNCVPEYYRSKFEDEAHEAELEMERFEWYRSNKKYREQKEKEGCRELCFYPVECEKCSHGEVAPPNNEYDDWPVMICSNWKNCQVYKRETEENIPDESEGEWPSWLEEK